MDVIHFDPKKPYDFIAIGRLCIDLNANEINRPMEETRSFTRYLGGSPANISIALAQLGMRVGFIGRVAADQFGRFILNYLREKGVDASSVVTDEPGSVTGLAFTEIKSPSECSILMYRDNVADLKLRPEDVKESYVKDAKGLLISGTALSKSPSREAVFTALGYAKKHDVRIFFDLDYRPFSWGSREEVAVYYALVAEQCDVVMGTRQEFDMMEALLAPGNNDDQVSAQRLFNQNAKMVLIKHGQSGSTAYVKGGPSYQAPAFRVNVLKTFGAGDSYAGALIYGLFQHWDIQKCLAYASAAAAIVVSSHSCSEAMPTAAQIAAFIAGYQAPV
jgi:5-dehydro-2-deoxygluconokinase